MSVDALLGWLQEGAIAVTAALLLALAVRRPLRRIFGAGVAYASWTLVPLSLLAVSLPAPVREAVPVAMMPALSLAAGDFAAMPVAARSSPISAAAMLAAIWAMGVSVAACRFWRQQRRYVDGLGCLRRDPDGTHRTEARDGCPAVVGAWRPRIVLPADFETRYPAAEGELVLAHERVHFARQDVRLNLLAVALRCLHWFNPLLHWAASAYRQDQELACDATVLTRHPHSRRAYADAMLKTQLAVLGLPVGCHWQSSQSLKERILMLKRPLPRRGIARAGGVIVFGLAVAVSYAAWALQPESANRAPALLGKMLKGEVVYADVAVRPAGVPVFVVDGAMGNGPGGASRAFSGADGTLKLGIGASPEAPDALLLVAGLAGAGDARPLQWQLERAGAKIDGGSAAMPAGKAVMLDIDGSKYGSAHSAAIRVAHSPAGMMMGEFDQPGRRFSRAADGAYVDASGSSVWDARFKTAGKAQVVLNVTARGDVADAVVESSTPADAFTDADARALFGYNKYAPLLVGGKAVPGRISTTAHFSPPAPDSTAQSDSTPQPTAESWQLNPPRYPPGLAKQGIGGTVVLIVDVAANGRPTAVKVDRAEPAGVFDAVAIEAAYKWTFQPQLKNGKPVPGRVRVPIQFAPDDAAAREPWPPPPSIEGVKGSRQAS